MSQYNIFILNEPQSRSAFKATGIFCLTPCVRQRTTAPVKNKNKYRVYEYSLYLCVQRAKAQTSRARFVVQQIHNTLNMCCLSLSACKRRDS